MKRNRGRIVQIDSLDEFDRRFAQGARDLSGWRIMAVDLSQRSRELRAADVAGALFLGCVFDNHDEDSVRARGAVVFPEVPSVPVDTYRTTLYAPDELYDTEDYHSSLDARTYAWSQQNHSIDATLAEALHDHAIDAALAAWVSDRELVGVMGGHAFKRDESTYADAATLGWLLGQRLTVATGGGPGAMEAANLGGYLSAEDADSVEVALATLRRVPRFRPDIGAWSRAAFEVRERNGTGAASLGIPTWHYGHEPPNAFASAIAKYFHNAQREAILLEVCQAGIVFLPGAGGTVQEIFQDACENYYADESAVAPMVLVGGDYWTREFPAWPLLKSLAAGRPMEQHVHLVESVQDAAALVLEGRQ
ncbi:Predicted Rossmann fold nucleotide-binding protein [Paramicrobacterium humi]|uniref:Predicted Rossmann fold nucleotide-binding protein n=1 Tax=Paramicrobacterium humi TaxID=640635 RepID=A0A1H4K8U4_9MICO|nr:LOG family protein [Microbacterium humi]SEB54352.1 Predicted Rossmann fold nucleotide-binding protein [Microbacterium humi]